jgi:Domain of unknown function (DUF4326)
MKPVRIQLSRKKGWRMPADTEKVDRSTGWGNPFVISSKIDAQEAVRLFAAWIEEHPIFVEKIKAHLVGKNLACWCKPGAPCHADVLLKIANEPSTKGKT